ncbi:hypothetical protein C8A00DRAFT_30889 [Chaetomidium leptoderma]|uniref:GATA-type domain-containing protein n=1 Tax=Chaetomidium leptoderma TaxID=669021 RepID=A0AAN6ZZ94_9PEZI|nr:hypothetical protein C8A00DRAFT_30889 [Chaetomidium leptoderma]
MATALISPNTPYHHQHHSSFSSGYPHSAPATGMPGMISPVEPRRPSDDSEHGHAHRQSLPSLPSISEVFSERRSLGYAPPPSGAPMPLGPGLPSPFASAPPPRPFADAGSSDKNPSPRTLHPITSTFARPETLPAFSDPTRPVLASRPVPPPLNTFPGHQPSPPVKLEHFEAEQRHAEGQSLSAGHRPQPPPPLTGLYSETGRLPPGQLPLSAYPISPRHSGPPLPSPYDSRGPPAYGEEGDYPPQRPSDYKANFDKHFQTNGYQDALQAIMSSCRTGYHFAEAYVAAAREQQGAQPIPSRMPTENEVSVLLNSLVYALKKLEDVRDMVQANRLQSERARDSGGHSPEDEDVSMYGDGIKPAYSMHEVKKRRGRAAPPGRCHSCNRVDTPEWRRGPDGARTLCNACGLHYAKLERKRQLDQRSLRPKPADERK